MAVPAPAPTNALFLAHLLAFGTAAVACFASVLRARSVEDRDTRRGLVALLLTSGGWATAHVFFLVAPSVPLKTAFHTIGLVIGLAGVGPWLYFCSAYSGRSLHRNTALRRAAVGTYLAITLVKLTNPIHHLYFTSEFVTQPFPHLAVDLGLVHWLVMGLSYALAAVGYFMLLELFLETGSDTRGLGVLVTLTGVPLALNVAGIVFPSLLELTYEPLGVAAFAVGVCFVYLEQFRAVQLASGRDEAAIVLTGDEQIRDYNDRARELFPDRLTREAIREDIHDILPSVVEAVRSEDSLVEREEGGRTRYYRVSTTPIGGSGSTLGQTVVLTDVTDREQYRRKLERQNERLDQFASMVSHDLRNPLNVAQGRLDMALEQYDDENLETVSDALTRMEEMIEDLLDLARQGQPIEEMEPVQLSTVANDSWKQVETADAVLTVEDDLQFEADPERVRNLFENLFRNAVEHAGEDVTVRVGRVADTAGFYVADDGPGISEDERERVFESGYSTAEGGTGFGLPIVEEIAEAHGWDVDVTESEDGGARFEFTSTDSAQ